MAKTYIQRDTSRASGVHSAISEIALEFAPASGATLDVTYGTGWFITHLFTTPAGEPNSAQWPTGTYVCQLDCSTVTAGDDYGLSSSGHFARVNTGLTSDSETHVQTESRFTTTGLKLATYTGSWSSGNASDRLEVAVEGWAASSLNELDLDVNTVTSYVEGPWPAEALSQVKLPDQNYFCGPFYIGGAYYAPLVSKTGRILTMMKATSAPATDSSWGSVGTDIAAVDVASDPEVFRSVWSFWHTDGKLHVSTQAVYGRVAYHIFDPSSDTWTTSDEQVWMGV